MENQDTSKVDETVEQPLPPVIQTQNQLNGNSLKFVNLQHFFDFFTYFLSFSELPPKNEDTKIEDPIINEEPKDDIIEPEILQKNAYNAICLYSN